MINAEKIYTDLKNIREKSPLVHNITNYVVMNNTANALLAIGASPVMAHAVEEVKDMVSIASALVINIGTLSEKWVDAMLIAAKQAKLLKIPFILDPVGAGATPYRIEICNKIIKEACPNIIRGNASEIMSLVKAGTKTKGVDSLESSDSAVVSAKKLALQTNAIVSVSGETDYITDGNEVIEIKNGNKMMPKVTGMGCTATAITGAFAAVNKNYFLAAANAMAIMGISGEIAADLSNGPASLQMNFIDTLFNISDKDIKNRFLS